MSIFTRRDSETAPSPEPTPLPRPAPLAKPASSSPDHDRTQIASGSKVVGEVSGSAELQIDGQIEGKIDLDSRVVVGAQGKVQGEIRARSVQIGGQVRGNVQGLERVEVLSSGRLEGDMAAPKVHIADGAFFSGKVEMGPVAEAKGQRPADRARSAPRPEPEAPRKSGENRPRESDPAAAAQPGAPQPEGPQPVTHKADADSPSKGGTGK